MYFADRQMFERYPDKSGKMVFYQIGEVGFGQDADGRTLEEVPSLHLVKKRRVVKRSRILSRQNQKPAV